MRDLHRQFRALTGGEIPAMAVADAVCRMVPGVLPAGFRRKATGTDCWSTRSTPARKTGAARGFPVLLSGHHANIEAWRREMSLRRTKKDRPDLFVKFEPQDRRDRKILEKIRQDG